MNATPSVHAICLTFGILMGEVGSDLTTLNVKITQRQKIFLCANKMIKKKRCITFNALKKKWGKKPPFHYAPKPIHLNKYQNR